MACPAARYGTPLWDNRDVFLKIDVQGAATIRKTVPGAVFIIMVPESLDALRDRLARRETEDAEELELRLQTAQGRVVPCRGIRLPGGQPGWGIGAGGGGHRRDHPGGEVPRDAP